MYSYKNYKLGNKKQESSIPSFGWGKNVELNQYLEKSKEVIPIDVKREIFLDHPLEDLRCLIKDVDEFMEEL